MAAVAVMTVGSPVGGQSAPEVPTGFHAAALVSGPEIAGLNGIVATDDERLLIARGAGATGDSMLVEHDLVTGSTTPLITGLPLAHPDRMLIGAGGSLLGNDLILADHNSNEVSDCCDGRVFRIDLGTLDVTAIATGYPGGGGVGDPFGVAQANGGPFGSDLYVIDFQGASLLPPILYRVFDDGTTEPLVVDNPLWTTTASPKDIAFDPSGSYGGDLFVADEGAADVVWRVTPGGDVSVFAAFARPTAIAFGPGGAFGDALYVLDHVGAESTLYTLTPDGVASVFATGLRSVTADVPDLAFSPTGETLFVAIADEIVAISASSHFRRGDCNGDDSFDIADAVALLSTLFSGGDLPDCDDACDTNDDGGIDISDAVFALSSLFSGGVSPAAPFVECGADPTPDTLGCHAFTGCP